MTENSESHAFYDSEEYRDSIATVDKSGKRIWLYPKKPNGRLYEWRKKVSYVFLLLFFLMPFIKINGNPFLQLNIIQRKFSILGTLYFPQDFYIFLFFMLTGLLFIILFTVIFGRLFCGWVCPQTVFMEMVFRRFEYWIEGDWSQQKKLDAAAWNFEKIAKKSTKHALFLCISFLIANTLLSYIIGYEEVIHIASDPFSKHLGGLMALIVFTLAFYSVFAFMREQVCTTICPYGRLQGVLLDKDSIVISYDNVRGEPRSKIQKVNEPELGNLLSLAGDCIDCKLCIKVCPTGIDIRNGTQLECVNCTACIDVCDEVMVKVDRPKGLIRFDSSNGISNGKRKIFTPRAKAYIAVLLVLCLINTILFLSRKSIEINIFHTPGTIYQKMDGGYIGNVFNYQLVNKTNKDEEITFSISEYDASIMMVGKEEVTLKQAEKASGTFIIKIPESKLKDRKTKLLIKAKSSNKDYIIKTNFLGPIK